MAQDSGFSFPQQRFETAWGYKKVNRKVGFFQLQNWEKKAFVGDKWAEKFKKDSEFVIKLLISVKFYVTNVENWTFFT